MPQWNAAVLDPKSPAHKEPVATDAETMEVSVTDNHKVTGVLRDKSFGEPIGTWSVSESMAKTMRLLSDVADSNNELDGAVEAAWAVASKRKIVTWGPVEVGTSADPRSSKILKVITPSKISKREEMDFSALDDLFLDSGKKKLRSGSSSSALSAGAGGNRKGLHYSETVALGAKQLLRDAASSDVTALNWKTVNDRLEAVVVESSWCDLRSR